MSGHDSRGGAQSNGLPQTPLRPGLADPVLDAQLIFKRVMLAMANPGRLQSIEPVPDLEPVFGASMAVLLTLLDTDTPFWTDCSPVAPLRQHLQFHCGVPFVAEPQEAAFALICDPIHMPPLHHFAQGSDERPDRSCTLVIQSDGLRDSGGWRLSGPGIERTHRLDPGLLRPMLNKPLSCNHGRFPRGVDLILTHHRRIAALPRTTKVED